MAIALYARQSVEKDNSVSCATQIEYCRAMIKPDERSEKILTFIDNGYSGGNLDRDAFQKMMRQIERGNVSKLIVYRLDRISRSLADFVTILDTLKAHNVRFVSSQESFDTSSPYGEMIVKLLAVFAEFERQSIIARVTQAYQYRSELGIYMGGRRPYGFTLTEAVIHGIKTKMLSPVEEEVAHLRYIFEAYAVAGVSLRRLMDHLVQNNILPTTGSWSTSKLSTMLKNPIYVRADHAVYTYFSRQGVRMVSGVQEFDGVHGLQLYGKTTHAATAPDCSDMRAVVMKHEGIIPSDIWLNCQRKLEKNKQIGNSLSNGTSWLGGKLICRKCGHTMTVTKGAKHADGSRTRYFSCTGKSHNRVCSGVHTTLYADSLEDMVYALIDEKLASLKDGRRRVNGESTTRANLLKNRISEIGTAQQKLVDLMMDESIAPDMLTLVNERAKALAEEKRELIEKVELLEAQGSEVVHAIHFSRRWKSATYEQRRAVCNLLIDKILIDQDGTTEVVWNI